MSRSWRIGQDEQGGLGNGFATVVYPVEAEELAKTMTCPLTPWTMALPLLGLHADALIEDPPARGALAGTRAFGKSGDSGYIP